MYIDDDPDDQALFAEALDEIKPTIKCIMASDGLEALTLLQETDLPICIYLDLNMPLMSGMEVLRQIKSDHRLRQIPIFILTTSRNSTAEAEARSLGAIDYLTKPNSYIEFKKILHTCLLAHLDRSIVNKP